MLVQTTSCDGGLRVDLSCDVCGETYDPAATGGHSRRRLWAAASADGWALLPGGGAGRHQCPGCATGVDKTAATMV